MSQSNQNPTQTTTEVRTPTVERSTGQIKSLCAKHAAQWFSEETLMTEMPFGINLSVRRATNIDPKTKQRFSRLCDAAAPCKDEGTLSCAKVLIMRQRPKGASV